MCPRGAENKMWALSPMEGVSAWSCLWAYVDLFTKCYRGPLRLRTIAVNKATSNGDDDADRRCTNGWKFRSSDSPQIRWRCCLQPCRLILVEKPVVACRQIWRNVRPRNIDFWMTFVRYKYWLYAWPLWLQYIYNLCLRSRCTNNDQISIRWTEFIFDRRFDPSSTRVQCWNTLVQRRLWLH